MTKFLYSQKELDIVENHIKTYFGEYSNVFHEIVSPDIHLDIYIIEPYENHNYYTFVTCGAGAANMYTPPDYPYGKKAEFLISVPNIYTMEEIKKSPPELEWVFSLLKRIGRFSLENETFLGYGHTVGNYDHNELGELVLYPYAENTTLCCALITYPYVYGTKAHLCKLPVISTSKQDRMLQFYQVVPIYASELAFKIENNAESLEKLFELKDISMLADSNRKDFLNEAIPYI